MDTKYLHDSIPIASGKNGEIMYVRKSLFKFNTEFTDYYRKNNFYESIVLKDYISSIKDVPQVKQKRFVTIFHITRCRSTLLLQDLYETNCFNVINEPSCFSKYTSQYHMLLMQQILNASGCDREFFCHKAGHQYNFLFEAHLKAFPQSINFFLYRDPEEVFFSNILKLSRFSINLSDGSSLKAAMIQGEYIQRVLRYFTPLVKEGSVQPISYEDVGSMSGVKTVIGFLGMELQPNQLENIKNAREFHAHERAKRFQGSIGADQDQRYKFELTKKLVFKKFEIYRHWEKFQAALR